MDPEGHNCNLTSESMPHFEPVMGSRAEARMSTAQNDAEHQDKYIGSDDVWELIAARSLDEFSGGKSRVQEIPCHSSNAGTTVDAAIVEDESQSTSNEERRGMGNAGGDFVKEVYEILLAEENGDHEVSGGGISVGHPLLVEHLALAL